MKAIFLLGTLFLLLAVSASAEFCTDSDGPNNFNQAGYVQIGPTAYIDECQGNSAVDYRCETQYTKKYIRHYAQKSVKECAYSCIEGACAGKVEVSYDYPVANSDNSLTGQATGASSGSSSGQGGIVLVMFVVVAGLALYATMR